MQRAAEPYDAVRMRECARSIRCQRAEASARSPATVRGGAVPQPARKRGAVHVRPVPWQAVPVCPMRASAVLWRKEVNSERRKQRAMAEMKEKMLLTVCNLKSGRKCKCRVRSVCVSVRVEQLRRVASAVQEEMAFMRVKEWCYMWKTE